MQPQLRLPHKPQSFYAQLVDLTLIQLANWRWTWRGAIVTGALAPLASMLALGLFARDSVPGALGYVLTGNLVLSIMFQNQNRVCSNFSFMKHMGTLDYFASLPIRRTALILATMLSFLLLSLPSLAVTGIAGALLLKVEVNINPLLLLIVPLVATPLSGLGALIGASARTMEEANWLDMMLTFIMLGLGPVLVPPERLPGFMIFLGWFSPASYAASALRQVLIGPLSARLGLDVVALIGMSVLVLWFVSKKMDWRN